jgi:hypothetical protein
MWGPDAGDSFRKRVGGNRMVMRHHFLSYKQDIVIIHQFLKKPSIFVLDPNDNAHSLLIQRRKTNDALPTGKASKWVSLSRCLIGECVDGLKRGATPDGTTQRWRKQNQISTMDLPSTEIKMRLRQEVRTKTYGLSPKGD